MMCYVSLPWLSGFFFELTHLFSLCSCGWYCVVLCFRVDMINSSNQNENEVDIPQSATYATLFIFFLPDVIHCIYLTQAPGYNMRGFHRQVPQVIYSLLAQFGVRPLYELCWSFKWMQIMNYVTLQNEGSVVTDSGISER